MKVLVIDDSRNHLAAAVQTLTSHEVTICATHDEALKLLYPKSNDDLFRKLMKDYREAGVADAYEKASAESALPYWDVVLCDLMMPAGSNAQCQGSKFVGQEMSVGWSLALSAAKSGAKFVAVVTDMNHHSHPASAMLDSISGHVFVIDGAKMLMTNRVGRVGIAGTECTCEKCNGTGRMTYGAGKEDECYICKGSGIDFAEKGKDWGNILDQLIKDAQSQ